MMAIVHPADQVIDDNDEERAAAPAAPTTTGLLPSVGDGIERSLDPRLVALDRTIGWILTGSFSLAALIGLTGLSLTVFVAADRRTIWGAALLLLVLVMLWAAGTAALAWHLYRWPEIAHRHARYTIDEHGIEIRKGVYWRKVINVARSRVQHTDVSQGPLERRYGLGTVVIYTAGTVHAKVDLRGLDHATAMRIRDHLLPREGSDGV